MDLLPDEQGSDSPDGGYFEIEISQPTGGAIFDESTDGSKESSIARVTIARDESVHSIADRAMRRFRYDQQQVRLGAASYAEQFSKALQVGEAGGDGDGDGDGGGSGGDGDPPPPGAGDWILHILSLPWKLIFATIPPTSFCGGYLAFFCSLTYIGILTAFIGDLADLLGCVVGLKPSVVAITFVALGTSLPDTFASKAAAVGDATADAAVGNVTGSNAVNVFLGLGISWLVGAVYWGRAGASPEWMARYPEIAQKYGVRLGDPVGLAVPAGGAPH